MPMHLKVPPAINQFNMTIDINQTSSLLRLPKFYESEARAKTAHLMEEAQASGYLVCLEPRHDPCGVMWTPSGPSVCWLLAPLLSWTTRRWSRTETPC